MTKVIDKKLENDISRSLTEDMANYDDFEEWVETFFDCPPDSFFKLVEDNKALTEQIWEFARIVIARTRRELSTQGTL